MTPNAHASEAPPQWCIHVFAPCALVKDVNKDKDDVEHDNSYFIGTLDGQKMATEWTPEARLSIKRAVDGIPNVHEYIWHYIALSNAEKTLDFVLQHSHQLLSNPATADVQTVVLNFVDGMETDGWPGLTIIQGLEKRHLAFTGSDSKLYYLDSDKARIKRHLIESNSLTPGYCEVYSREEDDVHAEPLTAMSANPEEDDPPKQKNEDEKEEEDEEAEMAHKAVVLEQLAKLNFPLLVKPANSSSSRGISSKSVVDTPEEAYKEAMETKKIWGPVYVEEYITGREYTVLCAGSEATGIHVYKALERVFRSKIPERERMLTHDMKWGENKYGSDASVETASWWMQVCSDEDQERLQPQAKRIYASFHGNGYCRMDLREDHRTGKVYVVDVNANCSIDDDEDCAMGKILKASGLTLGQFFMTLMEDAVRARDELIAKSRA
ncbi:hypothetical protein BGZ83_011615 [Gryganskiella cystojenkinii]|nr:hypothetical protein BGZ83_011615 [Gryganskiella cystojenkinii]